MPFEVVNGADDWIVRFVLYFGAVLLKYFKFCVKQRFLRAKWWFCTVLSGFLF